MHVIRTAGLPRATLALSIACVASACGAAPARPDLDEAFARIQVHEATIAHREAEARACDGAPCPAADDVCDAAASICAIAREIQDADAGARCERARRSCPREEG